MADETRVRIMKEITMLLILSWSGTTCRIHKWIEPENHNTLMWDTITVPPVLAKAVDRPPQATKIMMTSMHSDNLLEDETESWAHTICERLVCEKLQLTKNLNLILASNCYDASSKGHDIPLMPSFNTEPKWMSYGSLETHTSM